MRSTAQVLFELAILRLFISSPDAKVVYMCPTRSLCSERARDWTTKFQVLGWSVVELTGESSYSATKALGGASVIVTTPEKWDMVTRRWYVPCPWDAVRALELIRLAQELPPQGPRQAPSPSVRIPSHSLSYIRSDPRDGAGLIGRAHV